MISLLKLTFWVSAIALTVNYLVYPLLVIALSRLCREPGGELALNRKEYPSVSLVIAAYNEKSVIDKKIRNSLALNYPGEKLQIAVVSDGSDDNTHQIASGYKAEGVLAIHDPVRAGKSAALNHGVSATSGDIIVFSDANNDFGEDALIRLVEHFTRPGVGAVTGAKHVYPESDREASEGDSLYWKYESRIKLAESKLGCITSGDGEIFAIRRELFKPIERYIINDDAALTFAVVDQGYRVLYEPKATSHESASKDLIDDFYVKVRMAAGGYQTIAEQRVMLFPPRTRFAWQFILHKLLRWLAPIFLLTTFISSALLIELPVYKIFLFLQVIFYSLALIGWYRRRLAGLSFVFYVPMYFSLMNLALLLGLFRYLNGQQGVNWRKAER